MPFNRVAITLWQSVCIDTVLNCLWVLVSVVEYSRARSIALSSAWYELECLDTGRCKTVGCLPKPWVYTTAEAPQGPGFLRADPSVKTMSVDGGSRAR